MTALTPMQKTVLACVPNAEDGTTDARKVAEQLYDLGVSYRGAQMVLYHLVDKGLIKVDEWGYYRP
jgi:hypothetical protein